MPRWQGKSRGTTLGYRIFVSVLKRFGVLPAYFLLRFVAFYYFLFSYGSSKHIFAYYNRKHGYNKIRSLLLVYQNYYLFGQTMIDKVVLMSGLPHRFSFDFDGEHYLRKMIDGGRGGLLLSAHIGNWEAAGHLLNRLNTRFNIVVFDGEHQKIKQYMEQVTGAKNFNVIVLRNDLSHVYEIMDAFKNNEIVCMHADRFVEGNKTITANLLGSDAEFPAGPFVIATRLKVPVSFVFAMKESDQHYHFYATKPKEYLKSSGKEIQDICNEYVLAMEEQVRRYPVQWFNYYKFWN